MSITEQTFRTIFEDMAFAKLGIEAKRLYTSQTGESSTSQIITDGSLREQMFKKNMSDKYVDSYLQGMYEGWLLSLYPPADYDMALEMKKLDNHLHIDLWLESPTSSKVSTGETMARMVFEYFRMPAWKQVAYHEHYNRFKVFCQYEGLMYRVTGASRLGDIWLAKDLNRECGYDKRVFVNNCSRWTVIDSVANVSYGEEAWNA